MFEFAQLLQEFHLSRQAETSFLSRTDKTVLVSHLKSNIACTNPICITNWFPGTFNESSSGSDSDSDFRSSFQQLAVILSPRRSNSTPDHYEQPLKGQSIPNIKKQPLTKQPLRRNVSI